MSLWGAPYSNLMGQYVILSLNGKPNSKLLELFIGILDGDGYIEIGPQKQYNNKNPNNQPNSTVRSRIVLRLHKKDKDLLIFFLTR